MIYHVNAAVCRSGDGSEVCPFKTIGEAAAVARAGDTVLVQPGIYRESVDPQFGGTGNNCRVTYRSAVPLGAVITAAEEVKSWTPYQGDVWLARINNRIFGGYNPYTTLVGGDWYWSTAPVHTGEVFLGGKAMYETQTLEAVLEPQVSPASWEPEASLFKWYTTQEGDETLIYANFRGADPNRENVEISVRNTCFQPTRTGVNYITLSGFAVRCAANRWAPPTAYQEGMIGPHWSKGWIIEDCEVSNARCSGISLGKYLQPLNEHRWSRWGYKNGTQLERDAICLAQKEGWTKENIGSHIVRRCNIHHCGQTGIVGHLGCVFSLIEDNHIHHINNKQDLTGAEIGGIKLHAAIDVIFRRNHIHHCTRGIWLDWQAQGSRITGNLFHDNTPPAGAYLPTALSWGEDIFVEVSHGPTLVDHNLMLSECALRLSTQGVALAHNLICGSMTYVGLGTDDSTKKLPSLRFTPYHEHHGTFVLGFANILHGDNRFYNNIFLQKPTRQDLVEYTQREGTDFALIELVSGTHPFDGYPTLEEYIARHDACNGNYEEDLDRYYDHLPVWTGGNVFLAGAKPCDRERDFAVDASPADAVLTAEGELVTDLYRLVPEMATAVVDTDRLGLAYQPEQCYEAPDGSPIVMDTDFFGQARGDRPLPGPFAKRGERFSLRDLPGME